MIQSYFPNGGAGGGVALAPVSNIATCAASKRVYIKWTDPEDIVVSGSTLAEWAGTILVRKAGSAPRNRKDGTIILDSKTRNTYQNSYYCDSGLTNGQVYYYQLFPYTTGGVYTSDNSNQFYLTPADTAPGNVTGKSAEAGGNGKLAIKWTDPADTVNADGITLSEWGSTTVAVKSGGYATGPNDSSAQTFTVTERNKYATTALVVDGLTNGTTYYVSFYPATKDGAVNTNATNRITGVANRMTISNVPSQSGSLTYNGSTQVPSWSNYDSNKMTKSETGKVNAGTYNSVSFIPKEDYMWSDGTTAAKTPSWTIQKANPSTPTLSKSSISLDSSHTSATFTVTRSGDGAVSAVSSNTSVATVSVSGTTVTVSSVNNATGSATITVTVGTGTNYNAYTGSDVQCSVTATFDLIYGVEWNGTSTTRLTRTDLAADFTDPVPAVNNGNGSSPFDNILPWSGMTVVTTDSAAGSLVKIPKFWYKLTKDGSKLKIQISAKEKSGFSVSPAHMDRGDGKGERNLVYIGRYHCNSSNYRSKSGQSPWTGIGISYSRSNIHNLGDTIWQMDFAMLFTIWLLYIVEFADWDSQEKIGYGCGEGSRSGSSYSGYSVTTGYTDNMSYHTGTSKSNRTTYGCGTQYRNIEGLWDNVFDWVDGCYYNANGFYVAINPADYASNNGTRIAVPANGYPTALSIAGSPFSMFYPSGSSGGSSSSYIPDGWYYNSSYPNIVFGGSYSVQSKTYGLFLIYYFRTSAYDVGCRLMKLP